MKAVVYSEPGIIRSGRDTKAVIRAQPGVDPGAQLRVCRTDIQLHEGEFLRAIR
jgi:hypothetical protein